MTIIPDPYVESYRGLRVPWVAQWSQEISTEPVQPFRYEQGIGIRYEDERPEDRQLGVLWMRTDVDRGGIPQFAQLNVYRQRDAMVHMLCQVCGLPARGSWLISAADPRPNGRPFTTTTPPTCHQCIVEARQQCPFLGRRGPGIRLLVRNYRHWAVWGDIVSVRGMRPHKMKGEIRIGDEYGMRRILARQLTVEIWDYRRLKD